MRRPWTEFLDPDAPDGAYLRWQEVEARVGVSRTTAWRLRQANDFPNPYVISAGRVAYKEREVEAWKASRGHRAGAEPHRPPTLPPTAKAPPLAPLPVAIESRHLPVAPKPPVVPTPLEDRIRAAADREAASAQSELFRASRRRRSPPPANGQIAFDF